MRTKVWFPGIDAQVEEMLQGCLACQLEDGWAAPQPIQVTPHPAKAWTDLAIDFFGPIPNGHYLMVVVDEFSRMPIVEEVSSTASEPVLHALDKIFGLLGIPKVIRRTMVHHL